MTSKEVINKCLFDMEMGIDFQSIKESIINFDNRESVIELSALNRLGKTMRCHLTVYPILKKSESQGEIQDGFILVLKDITENKQLEKKLSKNREAYNHLSRLYTMGDMVSDLAHEIGQPLASITGYVGGLLIRVEEKNLEKNELQDTLEKLSRFAGQASGIIDRVRGFIRKEQASYSWIKLSSLIGNVIEFFVTIIREREIQLTQFIDPDLNEVYVDVVHANQILINLIKNAIDAITEYPGNLRHIVVRVQRFEGSSFTVYLENSGPQFTQEEVDKMFDHYYTTKKTGVGLGLSISHSIAVACGGDLTARPRESGGVSFALRLPEIAKTGG